MIDPSADAQFPNNVVACYAIVLPGIDPDITIQKRMLRPTDPNYSLGVYATLWQPNEDSYEMGHFLGGGPAGPNESTLSTYQIGIQVLVKHGDTDQALAQGSILNRRVRSVLYRNNNLRIALAQLSVTDGTSTERLKRWGIRSQRYISNDIEGKFVFVSVLDTWIETEIS